jgi:hypothetical protein
VPTNEELFRNGQFGLAEGNCVRVSRYWYAYLLREPAEIPPGSARREYISKVIKTCDALPQRYAGNVAMYAIQKPPKSEVCAIYGEVAVAQYEASQLANCNFSGSRWNADANFHAKWCMTANDLEPMAERSTRAEALKACAH